MKKSKIIPFSYKTNQGVISLKLGLIITDGELIMILQIIKMEKLGVVLFLHANGVVRMNMILKIQMET